MNERFKELSDEAAAIVGIVGSRADFAQKFGELIVRECASVQAERSNARHGYDKHADGSAILQHFGVESKVSHHSLTELHPSRPVPLIKE